MALADVAIHEKETLDPLFYRCFEFSTLLPGPSQLTVDVLDYDRLTANDLIGRTVIDLEDRWFDESWRALGAEFEVPGPGTPEAPPRLRPKPLELRRLVKPPIVSRSEGQLSLWVDLLTPSEARAFPPVKIERPRSGDYEVRVIVWRTEDVLSMDTTGLNDLYVVAYVSGQEGMRQASDTHWRSKNGRGSFNWRFKFDVKLPMKYPYLTLQLFDKDVVKYNDFIAARTLSLAYYFEAALRNEGPTNCFAPPRRPAGTGPAAGMEGDTAAPTRAAPAVTDAPVTKTPRQLTGTQVAGDGGGGGGGGGGVAGVGPSGGLVVEAGRAAGGGAESAEHVVVDVAAHPASASGAAAAPVRRHQRRRRKRLALLKDKDASREARKSLRALKESIGLPDDINPKDALWITLERWYDPKRGGVRLETPMAAGRVLVSMEVRAAGACAGAGGGGGVTLRLARADPAEASGGDSAGGVWAGQAEPESVPVAADGPHAVQREPVLRAERVLGPARVPPLRLRGHARRRDQHGDLGGAVPEHHNSVVHGPAARLGDVAHHCYCAPVLRCARVLRRPPRVGSVQDPERATGRCAAGAARRGCLRAQPRCVSCVS